MRNLYSRVSYFDLKTKIALKTEEKLTDVQQLHETFVIVVSQALGGTTEPDASSAPKTADQLEARLTKMLG